MHRELLKGRTFRAAISVLAILIVLLGYHTMKLFGAEKNPDQLRKAAAKAQSAGNFKDAYDGFRKLALDPADDPMQVGSDLQNGVACLQQLARDDESDEFREQTIAAHKANWRLLKAAAESYQNDNHQGFIVAGKFYRGNRHGNDGKFVTAFERDRVRAMQLMEDAAASALNEPEKDEVAQFYFSFADMLLDRRYSDGAWRLQYLTDLTKLPDYEEGYGYGYYGGGNGRGAPVDENAKPVFHAVPKSWAAAKTDGERWRWCLVQATEYSPKVAARAKYVFASFLREQFDVQTMQQAGFNVGFMRGLGPVGEAQDDTRKDESGPFAVSTLKEDETIARLANGIKRFDLPSEFNFIKILQSLGDGPNTDGVAENSLSDLAGIFENRQQYDRAAGYWRTVIQKYGPGDNNVRQAALDQIVKNWVGFENIPTEPAGKDPTLPVRFRNGKKISFVAKEIDVKKLLADVKEYIKTRPTQLDWQKLQVDNVGYRLVEENQAQYLGKEVAKWNVDVQPRDGHFDKREWVKTPLKMAGAYLLSATIDGGNEAHIVVWIADTAIVKKAVDGGTYYFVADANSGKPVAKATLDFFGYRQRWTGNNNTFQIDTNQFADFTDADGQLIEKRPQEDAQYQWIISATTADGRFAYLGYTNIWGTERYDPAYNQNKVFTITDRPVYRPGQTAHFKTWIAQAKYDMKGKSPFAGKAFTVRILSPKGDELLKKTYTSDSFGGFDGDIDLAKDATLGVYNIQIVNAGNMHAMAGETFRVEEYKKPEFEVKVEAPTEPVMLGEKIAATVKCKYYFGAPVVNAKVKYKVLRTTLQTSWYPAGRWDWFYEPGYWWFGCDYTWYPGWNLWGLNRPMPSWYRGQSAPPELVIENEAAVGADGTVKIEIDTAIAKAIHGDEDHHYEITAEVTDESRRTITGTGSVSVARKPFKVYAWVDRGYYNAGDEITAEFSAQTVDNKPIKGIGKLKLLKVSYGVDGKPVEAEAGTWDVNTDDAGKAQQRMKAAEAGQYRLSYTVKDEKGHEIEGGYVFIVRGQDIAGKNFRFNDVELVADKKEYGPSDTLKLEVNANQENATVLLFLRPTNGVYLPPKVLRLEGKSTIETVNVAMKDMPNFFVEAVTVSNGKLFTDTREIVVPPESRVVNVAVTPSADRYKPGEKATVKFKLTDAMGQPVAGSAVVSIYDKSLEYISGGSNVGEIKSFFWKWRRSHYPQSESSLLRDSSPVAKSTEVQMGYLGVFGAVNESADGLTVLSAAPPPAAVPGGGGALFGGGIAHGRGRAFCAPGMLCV